MKTNLWNVQVSFSVTRDNDGVYPPFKQGETDSIWVKAISRKHKDILDAARRKLELAYGMELVEPQIMQGGFWSKPHENN